MKNLITDIEGILVGCAEDQKFSTGVTVLSGPRPFIAAVDVRGGGAGTRETEILKLESSIGRIDAIVLSGGSAFGLDASSEVQKLLLEEGKGYKVKDYTIPLVSSAVIFDLIPTNNYWENGVSIWKVLANKAYKNLSKKFLLGSKGAGYGANTATVKGGQGSASCEVELSNGKKIKVGSLVINNAVGNPLLNDGPNFLSGHLEINNEFGGLAQTKEKYDGKIRAKRISNDSDQLNTVIGIIATNAPLNRIQLKRLSIMCHGSISRSIHPSHTPMDGDTIFAISSSDKSCLVSEEINKLDLTIISTIAADTFSRACNRAIFEAKNIGGKPSWKDLFKN
jgi:L-aminopeptidase/D-esterase-like protein